MKSGFVALIGRPNAGKSTLLNALLNQKIAIISPKPQTTRNAIRGIRTDEDSQIVFVDTPGIHKPHHALGANMNKEALANAGGVDVIYYLVDASVPFGSGDEYVLNTLKQNRLPGFLLLNKIDLLSKDQLMELLIAWSKRYDFKEIFPVSAKMEDNLDALLNVTKNYLEDGIMYYPSDQVCDYPEQFIMAEIVREKLLLNMRDEIPHGTNVEVESFKERTDKNLIDISVVIYCERKSHKGMIIGKQGTMLKKIGSQARADIEEFLSAKVNMQCWVKVKEDWRDSNYILNDFGFTEE